MIIPASEINMFDGSRPPTIPEDLVKSVPKKKKSAVYAEKP